MSEAIDTTTVPEFIRPGSEQDQNKDPIPAAADVALEEINPVWNRLFAENRMLDYFERLRREDPVHFNESEVAGRYWSLTRYKEIKAVDTDHKNFSSAHGITLGFPIDQPLPEGALDVSMFIAMDQPKHDVQRKTVSPVVSTRNLAGMEALIRERTCEVLDSLPEGETFDWVDTVSIELTTRMLATLFDFPYEDRAKLTRWSDVATAVPGGGVIDTEEQRREELIECLVCFTQIWEDRKKNPTGDLVSMLAHGEETKDMEPMEFLGNLILLIVGGNDTTRNSMSGGVLALNQYPSEFEKLKNDHSLIPNMVAEVIRWQTPLAYMRRTANNDCIVGGKQIKAGDQMLMWYLSGNRDEDVFERGEELIIDRQNARNHLSFGFGIHRCMGNRLAEMQLRVLWEEILKRFENIEVVGDVERTFSSFVKGYTSMPVRVTRKK
ncbi:MAG: cytochrome P450 [Gammaproteobacteria bacterium TMED243]|mgnify:FL=1|nr:cytochrome P450 [Gammaproteobacteria bacterium]RPG31488.1 MAG: cytochrome P450 [Gammaproteobacteria bacterium TMED243]|tara:strand:- start:3495 stop:4805 length:1311 start_codon:yes stop_codon:yes gene_type:complete